jgi:hypothetical protein
MRSRVSDTWRGTVWTTRTLLIAYLAIGVGLTTQPDRFANTPSYANLLISAPAQLWGCAYIVVATLFIAWRLVQTTSTVPHPGFGIFVHTVALALTAWWWVAFIIRYATDDGTTIVNVVSWGVFLSLIARSAQGLNPERDV